MTSSRIRLRAVAAVFVLGALSFAGCKQGLGERCEQGDDCSSGYCFYNAGAWAETMMTNYVCTGPIPPNSIADAGETDGGGQGGSGPSFPTDTAPPQLGDGSSGGEDAPAAEVGAETAGSDAPAGSDAIDGSVDGSVDGQD
jgi:hypothetical protein